MNNRFRLNIFKGSAAASIGTTSQMVLYFLTIMLLTRFLPKSDFGIYVLIIAIANITNVLTGLGLNLTLVKYVASEKKSERDFVVLPVLTTRIIILLVVAILFFFFRSFISHLFKVNVDEFIQFVPIIFILGSFRDLFFNLLQGLNLFRRYAQVQIASSSIRFGSIGAAYLLHKLNLPNLIYLEMFIIGSTMLLQILSVPLKMISFKFPDWNYYRKIISFSFPLYLNNICNFVVERANVMLIGAFLTPVSIAYYDVAGKFPTAFKRIFNSFIVVFFPNISNLFSRGENEEAEKLMNQYLILFSTALSALIFAGFLFRNEVITLVFSPKYQASALAFAMMLIPFYIRAMTSIVGHSLVAAGHPSIPVKANSVSSVVGLGFSFVAIPKFDFMGAVYSVIFMSLVSLTIHYYFAFRVNVKPYVLKFVAPFLLALVLSGLFVLLQNSFIGIRIIALIAYFAICYLIIPQFRDFLRIFKEFAKSFLPGNARI
ncbi:MAG: oligosaccharide flippase family protein [Calditrichaeota bacterium]|nr:oligosaccharide flippase family protein [Calditrichota bacterium]